MSIADELLNDSMDRDNHTLDPTLDNPIPDSNNNIVGNNNIVEDDSIEHSINTIEESADD